MNKPAKALLLLAALLLAACGSSSHSSNNDSNSNSSSNSSSGSGSGNISGYYTDRNGTALVKFESGKAYITSSNGWTTKNGVSTKGVTTESDYTVDGNKIILKMPDNNLVLTRNRDGSISGFPGGDLEKSPSRLIGDYGMAYENVWHTMFTFHSNGKVEFHAPGIGSRSGTYEVRGHKVYITMMGDNGKVGTNPIGMDDRGCLIPPKRLSDPGSPLLYHMPHICKRF